VEYQRQFFDNLAQKMSITSLEGWYAIKGKQVMKYEGAGAVLARYNGSLQKGTFYNIYI
jgi:hypothetical protein